MAGQDPQKPAPAQALATGSERSFVSAFSRWRDVCRMPVTRYPGTAGDRCPAQAQGDSRLLLSLGPDQAGSRLLSGFAFGLLPAPDDRPRFDQRLVLGRNGRPA